MERLDTGMSACLNVQHNEINCFEAMPIDEWCVECLRKLGEQVVWFERRTFRELLSKWLDKYEGVSYAADAMDVANGDWTT